MSDKSGLQSVLLFFFFLQDLKETHCAFDFFPFFQSFIGSCAHKKILKLSLHWLKLLPDDVSSVVPPLIL